MAVDDFIELVTPLLVVRFWLKAFFCCNQSLKTNNLKRLNMLFQGQKDRSISHPFLNKTQVFRYEPTVFYTQIKQKMSLFLHHDVTILSHVIVDQLHGSTNIHVEVSNEVKPLPKATLIKQAQPEPLLGSVAIY